MARRTPMMEAARVVASLVPGLVDEANDDVLWHVFDHARLDTLSSGERAAYDLARELWLGNGPLARFLIYVDAVSANALMGAVCTALGPAWGLPASATR